MNQAELSNTNDGDMSTTAHSFLLCLWSTTPTQWQGTVRHLESDAHLAFLNLEQAIQWIEGHLTPTHLTTHRNGN